jgi:creatinine amidohydrolase
MLRIALSLVISTGCMVSGAQAKAPKPTGQVTRDLDRVNWMEFRELVPKKIDTVLLPTGTLEPHGVTANGADNLAPRAIAFEIADDVNAMVAPTVPYGVTGSMSNYPGAFQITEAIYRPFIKQVIEGLADNGFQNIIIINGHGGPQTAILQSVAAEVANERRGTRTLVVNWWSYGSAITKEVFGEDGGHAGLNETAFMQAIDPTLVHKDRYSKDMAVAYPQNKSWSATPFPTSIGLYKEGEGYPNFDQKQADEYFRRINASVAELVNDTIRRWDAAGV